MVTSPAPSLQVGQIPEDAVRTNDNSHVRILIHRHSFLKQKDDANGQIAVTAASRISRIAEDMLAQGTLRYGQMHL